MMRVTLAFILFLLPLRLLAQENATLVADSLTLTAENQLIAEGNVEIVFDGNVVSASRVIYDEASDRVQLEGPLFIRLPNGDVIAADSADLDQAFENGVLRSARLVLGQQVQIAANQLDRVDGRFSQLSSTVATSCQVCGTRAPLWEIRARRATRDEVAQQIYFENATFRIKGIPVLWVPRLRLPDPSLARSTGLLIPQLQLSTQLGTGIKLPYFITLGDSRDLTLTPYLSAETRTLEARYRQAFLRGDITISGAVSQDTLRDDEGLRSYAFVTGNFTLPGDFQLRFDYETVSDPAYLAEYGYSGKDRLDSAVGISRVRGDELIVTSLTYNESLRDGDTNRDLPPFVVDLRYERRFFPALTGGALTFETGYDAIYRTGETPGEGARDLVRLGFGADLQRDWVLPYGVLASANTSLAIDRFSVLDDPAFDEEQLRVVPGLLTTLRWPLIRQSSGGATNIISPTVSLGWSETLGDTAVPNEDSALVEFDEASLFSLHRFPGEDAVETGLRTAVALGWTRTGPNGWDSTLTFGRLFREVEDDRFSAASGLQGLRSDWLIAGQSDLPFGFAVNGRALINDEGDFRKTETRIRWSGDSLSLSAIYAFLPEDDQENRGRDISEWGVDGSYRLSERWRFTANGRYDLAADNAVEAGLGVAWRNECVTANLSASRRFTTSVNLEPSTEFGVAVGITGFSAGRSAGSVRGTCRG